MAEKSQNIGQNTKYLFYEKLPPGGIINKYCYLSNHEIVLIIHFVVHLEYQSIHKSQAKLIWQKNIYCHSQKSRCVYKVARVIFITSEGCFMVWTLLRSQITMLYINEYLFVSSNWHQFDLCSSSYAATFFWHVLLAITVTLRQDFDSSWCVTIAHKSDIIEISSIPHVQSSNMNFQNCCWIHSWSSSMLFYHSIALIAI